MVKASFSILNYFFDKVRIDYNSNGNNSRDLKIDFNPSGLFNSVDNKFTLTFDVRVYEDVGNNTVENKPFIEIRCNSVFKFEDLNSFDEIPDFFYKNSIAIMFPFIRAYISLITNQANIPGVLLPIMNLTELYSQLKERTSQE
jgi:preprotein translocase subunit SecB